VIVAPVHIGREAPKLIGMWGLVLHESSAEKLRNLVVLGSAVFVLLAVSGTGLVLFLRESRRRKAQVVSS
jgi:hypothetical protein